MKNWARLKEAFWAAVDCEPDERARQMADLAGVDPDLSRQLAALLAADARGESILPIVNPGAAGDSQQEPEEQTATSPADGDRPTRQGPSAIRTGAVLDGRYEIVARIAAGGMGEVFRARRTRLGDDVAVKVIHAAALENKGHRDRFMTEGRLCAALRHPNIVSVLDVGVDADFGPFLVMEFLNGQSLAQEIAAAGTLPPEKVRQIAVDLAAAIDLAHSRGLVHRDLKPANIVAHRYETGDVVHKIVDFGIGLMRRPDDEATQSTAGAQIMGSLAYASPEQLNGEPLDGRSDIYSFGIVVYQMLTGRPPFVERDAQTLIAKQLTGVPARPSELRPGLDPALDEVVLKALAKDPSHRWTTATAFARALTGLDPAPDRDKPPTGSGFERLKDRDSSGSGPGVMERYALGQLVAKGRLGSEVYEATHRAMGTRVAIRIMRRGVQSTWDAARARFLREARTMQIAHPSILQVRDYGEERDLLYVVTDFIVGPSLRHVLDANGALPWERAQRFVRDLASASHALHSHGTLAYGLTPETIRVTGEGPDEHLFVSSAGIVELQDVLAASSEEALRGLQLSNTDLFYVGPEVLLGEPPDGRTDVYTIGVLAYKMLTGKRPFAATNVPQLMMRIFAGDFEDPRGLAPGLAPTPRGSSSAASTGVRISGTPTPRSSRRRGSPPDESRLPSCAASRTVDLGFSREALPCTHPTTCHDASCWK